jgi:hypothetical protein
MTTIAYLSTLASAEMRVSVVLKLPVVAQKCQECLEPLWVFSLRMLGLQCI